MSKSELRPALTDWAEGLVRQPLDHWSNDLWMALGASLWGTGSCGFLVVERGDEANKPERAKAIQINSQLKVFCMPNTQLSDLKRESMRISSSDGSNVRRVLVTNLTDRSDWSGLISELISEFRVGELSEVIWPQSR